MTSHRALWDRVCKTDPKHVKPITGKDYSGNSPKPYYIVERLTEEFGPCGIGWGYEIKSERFERFSDDDVLHIAHVVFWYVIEGHQRASVEQMGQTKATYRTSSGKLKVDEDAPKKSVTDALVKCASYLGFAGDIFSGRWDDSKYVAELRREFAEQAEQPQEPQRKANGLLPGVGVHKPTDGAMESLDDEQQLYIQLLGSTIPKMFATEGVEAVYDRIEREQFDNIQLVALWSLLDSKVRSALKKEKEKRQIAAKNPALAAGAAAH